MLDIGWMELFLVAVLALVVIGPKELPDFVRGLGRMFGKVRRMYRDSLDSFQRLEREINLASRPEQNNAVPEYYELLPDHVKELLYTESPLRDREQERRREAEFERALENAKVTHAQRVAESAEHAEPAATLTGQAGERANHA